MFQQRVVDEIVSRVGDLPAIPAVVAEVLRVTDDPNSDMTKVSAVVQADPALTAKILRVSNSSYYGMKQYVGTIKLALVILGVREVRNIVLGISVFDALQNIASGGDLLHEIWDNSLRVAAVAKHLGVSMGLGLQGEEFITGLLSDIGKMVMLRCIGVSYLEVLKANRTDPVALCKAELQEVGCDHADIAMALAVRWNLPQALADALWRQYPREGYSLKTAGDPKLAAVVRIAKRAAIDDFSAPGKPLCLSETEAWEELAKAKNPVPPEKRFAFLATFIEELKSAPRLPL